MSRARRRVIRRRRQVAAGGLVLCCALLVFGSFRLAAALTDGPLATTSTRAPAAAPNAPGSPTSARSKPASGTAPTPGATVPATGEFARAPGGTVRHGTGKLVTYRVEVETGTGQSAPAFAAAVDATLADPASWAARGLWSVQRVAGEDVDLIIRLATSATVAEVCEAAGLVNAAYSSCQTGQFVMINLDRWLNAVPEYGGDVALYRQYVINHEVGHGLGLGHQTCPGPGRLAPVMQQQTLGLDGCRANGWPYVEGKLLVGAAAT